MCHFHHYLVEAAAACYGLFVEVEPPFLAANFVLGETFLPLGDTADFLPFVPFFAESV